MRVIMTMALATGLAVSQFQVEATAAGPPPPLQQTAQADCGTASATGSAGEKDQHMAGPGCSTASLGSRLAERRPGFWTADDAAPAPGQVVSEPRSAISSAALSQASSAGPPCRAIRSWWSSAASLGRRRLSPARCPTAAGRSPNPHRDYRRSRLPCHQSPPSVVPRMILALGAISLIGAPLQLGIGRRNPGSTASPRPWWCKTSIASIALVMSLGAMSLGVASLAAVLAAGSRAVLP
jgi:hypothetical protein